MIMTQENAGRREMLKTGVWQFAGSGDIDRNFCRIRRGIEAAARERLLAFHECALTGYPPLDTAADEIDFGQAELYRQELKALAKEYSMYLFVGSAVKEQGRRYNGVLVFTPEGTEGKPYYKRALWGWDLEHFAEGEQDGIYDIDGFRVGIRICFEVRFPEYFRELYRGKCDFCIVSFCDIRDGGMEGFRHGDCLKQNMERYRMIQAYLQTRAMENVIPVMSVNRCSVYQTAPTSVIDRNGKVLAAAEREREELITYELRREELNFGEQGRAFMNDRLTLDNKKNY